MQQGGSSPSPTGTTCVSEASRLKVRGKADTVSLRVVNDGSSFVNRTVEDFLWLCEMVVLMFPGAVLAPPPCAEGVSFPSQRSGQLARYLERARQTADAFVKRLTSSSFSAEIRASEAAVAFLYATDAVWEKEKPRFEAEARSQSPFSSYKGVLFSLAPNPLARTWTRLKDAFSPTTSRRELPPEERHPRDEEVFYVDRGLKKLANEDKRRRRQQRQGGAAAADNNFSETRRVLAYAAHREAEREARSEAAKRRCEALAVAYAKRTEAFEALSASTTALARADADERTASLVAALGRALGEQTEKTSLADAVDDARLLSRAASVALTCRQAVADALGDANGRAARAKTSHAKSEAALQAIREHRSNWLSAQQDDDLEVRVERKAPEDPLEENVAVKAESVAATQRRSSYPVVVASQDDSLVTTTRDSVLSRDSFLSSPYGESPLSLALEEEEKSFASSARDAASATCAPVARLATTVPDHLGENCRALETTHCGFKSGDETIGDLDLQLRVAQSKADAARREASDAAASEAAIEVALGQSTTRVAQHLLQANAYRAAELTTHLRHVASGEVRAAQQQQQLWQTLHDDAANLNVGLPVVVATKPGAQGGFFGGSWDPASSSSSTTDKRRLSKATPVLPDDAAWYNEY